jgi:hypothetical protein
LTPRPALPSVQHLSRSSGRAIVPSPRRPPVAPLALVAGALLVAGAGLAHPLLTGDGPAQLAIIAATRAWRAIHLALVAGEILLVAGVAGVSLRHADTAGAGATRAGALLFALGVALSLIQILFMVGAGSALAAVYVRGGAGLAATQAVFAYDVLHPFAQVAGRAGELTLGLALATLGWGTLAGGRWPRWVGYGGVAAGVACAAWALGVRETDPRLMAGVGLVAAWAFVGGVVMQLGERRTGTA